MAARAGHRAGHRLAGARRASRGAAGAPLRSRGSSGARDRELRAGPQRPGSQRSRPPPLVTMHGVEPPLFRQLLGRFATGVTVLTPRPPGDGGGEPTGITASPVASVSLDPPLVLVS